MSTAFKFVMSIFLMTAATSCYDGSGDGYGDGGGAPEDTSAAWTAVANVVAKDCASCHNGSKEPFLTPSSVFKSSPVKAKLNAGAMPPPPGAISDADKQVLLGYAVK